MGNDFFRDSFGTSLTRTLVLLFLFTVAPKAVANEFAGDWSIELESGTPAWMSVQETDKNPTVYFRLHVGPVGPHPNVEESDGRLKFTLKQNKKATTIKTVEVGLKDGKLQGVISSVAKDGSVTLDALTAKKIPPMPKTAPDLSKVRFGRPVSLFNGKDLTGWRPHEADKINGWSVKDGCLVNSTPKTDFSATGAYANLRTESEFEDFWLHIEFQVGESRNSGVYIARHVRSPGRRSRQLDAGHPGRWRRFWKGRPDQECRQKRGRVANL